ncbi:GTP-binding protein [Psychromonas sp. RZ22]|uniref:GTPase n=1 Tax=Psychromonas algarum TaxID=2555643 RepID=UPI0010674B82|nr:GTPase [Psychromonas sp. RZ22]TEW54141.1 GTP-binding protein [Psychromonas sp. RZ22]
MNKIKNLFLLLFELSGGLWGIIVISVIFPALVMMGFGIFLAVKYGYILELSIVSAVSILIVATPFFLFSRTVKHKQTKKLIDQSEAVDSEFVKASNDWSNNEILIWQKAKQHSRQLMVDQNEWRSLYDIALSIMVLVAQEFEKKALDFTIPEGLQLFEEVSHRYRQLLKKYGIASEKLKISHLKAGYEAYGKYGDVGSKAIKVAFWANHAKNLFINPSKVAIDLFSQKSTSSMSKGFVEDMQLKAKQALLDEVASVAIDLYSGRFSFDDDDVSASSISEKDQQRMATQLEPIRIVLVGQTSAGKSSIINMLEKELVAEVDVLPSTDNTTVYSVLLDEAEVHIVDLQGLDGTEKTESQMLLEMTQADLILWVLKADQPARELDKALKAKFDAYYANTDNISRKKPAVIGVVNQVDRLKPIADWQPPYNLEEPQTAKEKMICQALDYNQQLLSPDAILALSIATDQKTFGVELFKQIVHQEIIHASNVQRNRQRMETIKKGHGFKKQFKRALNASKKMSPRILKSGASKVNKVVIKKVIK